MTRIMRGWNDAGMAVERRWITLNEGDTLRLHGAAGLRVQVAALSTAAVPLLWLTEEGEADDVFLRAGVIHSRSSPSTAPRAAGAACSSSGAQK